MGSEVHESARRLKAAVIIRLADSCNQQHRKGLMRAVQLCEKFINSNASSVAAFQVLKDEVSKALTTKQQTEGEKQRSFATRAARTRPTYATQHGAQKQVQHERSSTSIAHRVHDHQERPQPPAPPSRPHQVPGVLLLDPTSPDLPTARLEHKAHLTLNAFDKIMLREADRTQQESLQKECQRQQQQQRLAAMRAAQVAEVHAQREAARLAKLKEIEDMDAAVQAACEAELLERQKQKAAQQRQWQLYRQQQQELEAVKQAAAAAAAREQALDRAELLAEEARDAAAAAERAAAARAQLEAFKAESEAAIRSKQLAAEATRERERQFVLDCQKVMDAAAAKRLADQEAWRTKQRTKYEAAGGTGMELYLRQQALEDAARAEREQAAHEARLAAAEAAQRAAREAATKQLLQGLSLQMAEKSAARQAAEAAKQAEREAALAEARALEADRAAAKQQHRQRQRQTQLLAQRELAAWRQRKFDELNAPMVAGDAWVHSKVMQGQDRAFV